MKLRTPLNLIEPFLLYLHLTLPLREEDVLNYTQFVLEIVEAPSRKSFGQYVHCLLCCRNVRKSDLSPLNTIYNKVVLDIDMFREVVEHWIVKDFNAT